MAKGASIKFMSYQATVPKLLSLLKVDQELAKHHKIVLKPSLTLPYEGAEAKHTPVQFVEEVVKFCLTHKNPAAEVIIAEGAEGESTEELFQQLGYDKLAEKYGIALLDLNTADVQEITTRGFLKFDSIFFPEVLKDSFVISLPKLSECAETELAGSLSNMLGAFPASHYKGFFSKKKSKIRRWPIEYSIHDILVCKSPNLAIMDASEQGLILAGIPLEIDKQAAKLIGRDSLTIPYLHLLEEQLALHSQKKDKTTNPQ